MTKRLSFGSVVFLVLCLVFLLPSCSSGNGDDDEFGDDMFAGLRESLEPGELRCNGDDCCFKRCGGNNDVLCVTRQAETYMELFDPPFEGCDRLIFPKWFYQHDCFILAEFYSGHHGGYKGEISKVTMIGPSYSETSEVTFFYPFIQCFCGRTGAGYAGESSTEQAFVYHGCDQTVGVSGELYENLFSCEDECQTCEPRCAGRECGPDGCGGNCGTCPPGRECSISGQCIDSSSSDPCRECLETCRGLPGCCTGCGCICEEECGGCF